MSLAMMDEAPDMDTRISEQTLNRVRAAFHRNFPRAWGKHRHMSSQGKLRRKPTSEEVVRLKEDRWFSHQEERRLVMEYSAGGVQRTVGENTWLR